MEFRQGVFSDGGQQVDLLRYCVQYHRIHGNRFQRHNFRLRTNFVGQNLHHDGHQGWSWNNKTSYWTAISCCWRYTRQSIFDGGFIHGDLQRERDRFTGQTRREVVSKSEGSWERAGRGVRGGCDHRERSLSRHRLQHHGAGGKEQTLCRDQNEWSQQPKSHNIQDLSGKHKPSGWDCGWDKWRGYWR